MQALSPDTGVVHVDGVALRYHASGRGLPTLVIGSAVYYPRLFSQRLRQHLRLICVDHRGFTDPSPAQDPAAIDLDTLADDLDRVRQALGLSHVVVMGHSGHGAMALHYARRYPAHVSQVVLIAAGPDSGPASHAAADRYLDESVCPERKALLAERLAALPAALAAAPQRRFATLSVYLGPRSWHDPAYDAAPLWEGVPLNMPILDHVWGVLLRDVAPAPLRAPVLLALGRHDYLVAPPHAWEPLRAHFADLTVRVFEQSGHAPPLEEPEAFDAELLAWLQRPQHGAEESGLATLFEDRARD